MSTKTFTIIVSVLGVLVVLEAALIAGLYLRRSPDLVVSNAVQQGGSKNMLPANTANATQSNSAANNGTTSNTTSSSNTVSNSTTSGSTATGAPKLVSSTPKDTEQVQGSVTKISLTFDVPLDPSTTIKISRNSYDVTSGSPIFSNDRKTVEIGLSAAATSTYEVSYTACTGVNTNCTIGATTFHLSYTGGNNRLPEKSTPLAQ